MDRIELLFLGTGTSAGVPMIGCHCETCRSADPRDHRTRPSVVVGCNGAAALIDATPELRLQCVANGVEMIDAIVMTHAHADHIMGLDDVRRFNVLGNRALDVWADGPTHQVLERCFGYAFREPEPVMRQFRPNLRHRQIDGPFDVGPMTFMPVPLFHGEMPILGFRVGRLAYCTDVSRIPEQSFALLEGLDVLVLDGLQRHKHPTHFSVDEAIAAAQRIGAGETWLTHIAHSLPHEATNRTLPRGIQLAHDGLRVSARM